MTQTYQDGTPVPVYGKNFFLPTSIQQYSLMKERCETTVFLIMARQGKIGRSSFKIRTLGSVSFNQRQTETSCTNYDLFFFFFFSVAGAPMQSAGTPQGQPQPSPSQSGQFVFSSPMPGQPQVGAPPQGQVTPGPAPYVYIPSVAPNAVPTSTPSSVSYMPGE